VESQKLKREAETHPFGEKGMSTFTVRLH
jgi:hypothetical protein